MTGIATPIPIDEARARAGRGRQGQRAGRSPAAAYADSRERCQEDNSPRPGACRAYVQERRLPHSSPFTPHCVRAQAAARAAAAVAQAAGARARQVQHRTGSGRARA